MKIAFARSNRIGSWLIRALTFSRWSHVAVIDGEKIIDATFAHGVAWRPLADLLASNEVEVIDIPCNHMAAMMFLAQQAGKPYDWRALLGLPFSRRWGEDDAWFCSELVTAALKAGGKTLFREDASRIVPQHLWMLEPEPFDD